MNQNQFDRLSHLVRTWQQHGKNGLRPSEKDELIDLFLKLLRHQADRRAVPTGAGTDQEGRPSFLQLLSALWAAEDEHEQKRK